MGVGGKRGGAFFVKSTVKKTETIAVTALCEKLKTCFRGKPNKRLDVL